jgi:two-component system cell cycle response regulator
MRDALNTGVLAGREVLVIDDDPSVLKMVADVLYFYGATVHTAADGREGVTLAQALAPDFIVTDLTMPYVDGWDMLFELRLHAQTAAIPVVAMTGRRDTGNHERALLAGFDHFVNKPITPSLFIHDLIRILERVPNMKPHRAL